jgi:hypothetical protein
MPEHRLPSSMSTAAASARRQKLCVGMWTGALSRVVRGEQQSRRRSCHVRRPLPGGRAHLARAASVVACRGRGRLRRRSCRPCFAITSVVAAQGMDPRDARRTSLPIVSASPVTGPSATLTLDERRSISGDVWRPSLGGGRQFSATA